MVMLKTCSQCGGLHDINDGRCQRGRQKRTTSAVAFRNTNQWQKKRAAIKERDKYLCQLCLRGLYGTWRTFNYDKLEVHHITPLEEDKSKCLDDGNLITVCAHHHKMADAGTVPRDVLITLTKLTA